MNVAGINHYVELNQVLKQRKEKKRRKERKKKRDSFISSTLDSHLTYICSLREIWLEYRFTSKVENHWGNLFFSDFCFSVEYVINTFAIKKSTVFLKQGFLFLNEYLNIP